MNQYAVARTTNYADSSAIEQLLSRLDGVRSAGKDRWQARCPAHDDKRPSLSIGLGDNNCVLLKCWSGCTALSVVQALGLSLQDLFEGDHHHAPQERSRNRLRPNWRELLLLLGYESLMVLLAASKVRSGGSLDEDEWQHLEEAYDAITRIVRVSGASTNSINMHSINMNYGG